MAVEVKIPPMGESITGGLLAAWLVKSGDAVRKGQPLFSYETDKVTSEGTAEVDGQITIVVNAGTDVVVGQVVASIEAGAAGNAPSAAPAPAAKPAAASAPAATAAPAPKAAPVAAKSGAAAEVSPAVRRISEETGLDPAGHARRAFRPGSDPRRGSGRLALRCSRRTGRRRRHSFA
jgi:2-oxoglutarate dehydrogenase E2 component (dihydrolipoamide succinyltransferase)